MSDTMKPMYFLDAEREFGTETASGLVGDFLKKWGPVLGPIMLKMFLKWAGIPSAGQPTPGEKVPQHALVSSDTLRHWAAAVLKQHQAEIEEAITAQVHTIVTEGIAALDA